MTTKEAKRAVLLQEWTRMIKQRQESGLTVIEWCSQNNIKPTCYYYRLSQVRKEILEQRNLLPSSAQGTVMPTLVKVDVMPAEQEQLPVSKAPADQFFHLQYKGSVLDIPVGTGAEDIAEVLKAMGQYAGNVFARR